MPKKIAGLDQKQAIILFVVVAVGVFLYLRHKNTNTAASVSAPSAEQTSSPYPAAAQDSSGGASSAGAQDPSLAELLNQFSTTPPYYYYNTGGNTTTTSNYYGQGSTGGNDTINERPPIVEPGHITSPPSPGGSVFNPVYAPTPLAVPRIAPGIGGSTITSPFGGTLTVGNTGGGAGGRTPLKV